MRRERPEGDRVGPRDARAPGRRDPARRGAAARLAGVALPAALALLGAAPFATAPARAAEQLLVLDPEATRIGFELPATLHVVRGSARLIEGAIRFDADTGAARGRLRVDARSAETGIDSRDRRMHAEVLRSDAHPEISYAVRGIAVRRTGPDTAEVELAGELTLLGVEHALRVPAELRRDGERLTGSARFTLPYVEWGLRDVSSFVLRVGKRVDVTLELAGTLADAPPGAAP